jgi:catalase (peroxidase I)
MSEYSTVRKDIKKILVSDHDDGSIGPLLVRLAWHSSGTYDKHSQSGGSNGATMRFSPENTDPANVGLDKAR